MYKAIDITGQRFGKLIVIERDKSKYNNKKYSNTAAYWKCLCDCGNEKSIHSQSLRKGKSLGCGKCNFEDESGKRYGKWTVIKRVDTPLGLAYHVFFLCRCDCGTERAVNGKMLRNGGSESCGCSKVLPNNGGACNAIYNSYMRQADNRKLTWSIDRNTFKILIEKDCHYCGAPPSQAWNYSKSSKQIYNGLDRVDNQLGYVEENIVPCCKTCNYAKRSLTLDEFHDWTKRVYFRSIYVEPSTQDREIEGSLTVDHEGCYVHEVSE